MCKEMGENIFMVRFKTKTQPEESTEFELCTHLRILPYFERSDVEAVNYGVFKLHLFPSGTHILGCCFSKETFHNANKPTVTTFQRKPNLNKYCTPLIAHLWRCEGWAEQYHSLLIRFLCLQQGTDSHFILFVQKGYAICIKDTTFRYT